MFNKTVRVADKLIFNHFVFCDAKARGGAHTQGTLVESVGDVAAWSHAKLHQGLLCSPQVTDVLSCPDRLGFLGLEQVSPLDRGWDQERCQHLQPASGAAVPH
jgi:hypothetical protein